MFRHRSSFDVRTYDCGSDGNIHLNALMQHLQEAASVHAEELSFGYSFMREHGWFWVLVDFRIELERLPRYGEVVSLETWPSGNDAIKAFREFIGVGPEGKPLFKATSDWMVLDKGSRQGMPKDMNELGLTSLSGGDRTMGGLKRLRPWEGYSGAGGIIVPYSSIDMNGHVNNTEYVKWGLDAAKRSRPDIKDVKSMQISFSAEVFEGDQIRLFSAGKGRGDLSVKGQRASDGKTAFLMEIGIK